MVRYTHNINLPKGSSDATPYLPMVKAIPPKAPTGASFITQCKALNTYEEAI